MALLESEQGYFCVRSAGSHGEADIVALHKSRPTLLIQVKTDKRGPFANFGPASRAELLAAAEACGEGVRAVLLHWPPNESPKWLYADEGEWPDAKGEAA
jgi:hypothetical protein